MRESFVFSFDEFIVLVDGQTAILWGFKIDAILHRVKQDRRFAHVRYPLVKKAVDQLVMRSLLYYTWGDEKVLAIL